MSKLLVANLKMNLNKDDIINYKDIIEKSCIINLIIAPSSIYLCLMQSSKYNLCAQNAYYEDNGAYTGEVSFRQLNSLDIHYSLIGHSERRNIFNEDNDMISKKVKACIKNNITPILCIGETKEERDADKTFEVLDLELKSVLDANTSLVIAYEPIWAIGTGIVPTPDDIKRVHLHIKEVLNNKNIKVLYGGSVNASNIKEICNIVEVDGVLIGGASNNPNNLIDMYNIIRNM